MLSTTATERVIDGVHRDTAHGGPLPPASAHLVVFVSSLHHRFLRSTATGDDTDRGPTARMKAFYGATREFDDGCITFVRDQRRVDPTRSGEGSTITWVRLHVTDWNALRDLRKRERIPWLDVGLDANLNFVTRSDTFWNENESSIAIVEFDIGDRRAASRIVFDVEDGSRYEIAITAFVRELCLVSVRRSPEGRAAASASLSLNSLSHVRTPRFVK